MHSNGLANGCVPGVHESDDDPPSTQPRTKRSAEASPDSTVLLCVQVMPPDARIFLDDTLISVGPHRGRIPCELRWRVLRAVAPGYVSWAEVIMPVTDITVAVALGRKAQSTPPPPRPIRVVLRQPEEPVPDSTPPSSTDPLAITVGW
ncbi:hypothetical protein [Polyangium fumosum]|uniref:PEGA domain-containing protein n=1 Tax=Polyangium fumosum TaxID=889272 RepID=A0A4U1JFV6_9BACT|nr:hypothetical protein [Polyangium fumosum]TKD08929.1 hypothetical protein E8A74_14185 [Polyangium fumosum]